MELQTEGANLLVIESSETYREIVQSLILSVNNDMNNWIFSDDEKILKKSLSMDIVTSLFTLDFENKKIQKSIIDNLYDIAVGEKYYIKTHELISNLESFFYELDFESSYNAKVEIADFKNVLKAGITGLVTPNDLIEQFDEYIKISSRLLKNRILVLINMLEYFNEIEWKQIEKTAMYEGAYLVCIEKNDNCRIQNKVIIDSDWCRIV